MHTILDDALKDIQQHIGIEYNDAKELFDITMPLFIQAVNDITTQSTINAHTRALVHKLNNHLPHVGNHELGESFKTFEADVIRHNVEYDATMPMFYQMRMKQLIVGAQRHLQEIEQALA